MAAHRFGEPTSSDDTASERVRARIALGVTHDPQNACEIIQEIQASEPEEKPIERIVIALAAKNHASKYSVCFRPDENRRREPPPVLTYDSGTVDSGSWKPDDPLAVRFRNQLQTFESWMAPTLVSRLKSHLDHSALVIAVALHSPEQEQTLCQILLQRAVDYIYVQDVPNLHS